MGTSVPQIQPRYLRVNVTVIYQFYGTNFKHGINITTLSGEEYAITDTCVAFSATVKSASSFRTNFSSLSKLSAPTLADESTRNTSST
jgi:hypothetical protein